MYARGVAAIESRMGRVSMRVIAFDYGIEAPRSGAAWSGAWDLRDEEREAPHRAPATKDDADDTARLVHPFVLNRLASIVLGLFPLVPAVCNIVELRRRSGSCLARQVRPCCLRGLGPAAGLIDPEDSSAQGLDPGLRACESEP
jgi:hypothetical protein